MCTQKIWIVWLNTDVACVIGLVELDINKKVQWFVKTFLTILIEENVQMEIFMMLTDQLIQKIHSLIAFEGGVLRGQVGLDVR